MYLGTIWFFKIPSIIFPKLYLFRNRQMKKYQQIIVGMTILSSLTVTAQASLFDRGNGMIYDDTLNITWLQDANLAASNQFGITTTNSQGYGIRIDSDKKGRMTWNTANDWIAAMNTSDNGSGYKGYSDWRLWSVPSAANICYGFNCSDSELGHLSYQDLGGNGGESLLGSNDVDLSLFHNIQDGEYWSNTSYTSWSAAAWSFWTNDGRQTKNDKTSNQFYAWTVRAGDVTGITPTAVAPVPVPAALWLFGSSLLGLASYQRRRTS